MPRFSCFFHFVLLFWNQILTCCSVTHNSLQQTGEYPGQTPRCSPAQMRSLGGVEVFLGFKHFLPERENCGSGCVRWGMWLTWWRSASQWMWFSSSCAGWSPWGPWVAWCPVAWGCPQWSVVWRCHSVCPVSPSPRPVPSQTAVTSLLSSHRPWVVSRTAAGSLRTLDTNGDDALQTYFQIQQGYKSIQYQRGLQQLISVLRTKSINIRFAIKTEIKLTESNKSQILKTLI